MNIQPVPAQMIIQQTYEEGFHDGYRQAMREMPEIVRCKDCKHYEPNRLFECRLHGSCQPKPDWYCADGERKTDDA